MPLFNIIITFDVLLTREYRASMVPSALDVSLSSLYFTDIIILGVTQNDSRQDALHLDIYELNKVESLSTRYLLHFVAFWSTPPSTHSQN